MKKFKNIIKYIGIYFVSFVLIAFSISKFFDLQFQIFNFTWYQPLKDLSPMSLAWSFFGHSYRYNLFLGILEFLAGCLIVFNRTRLVGLLIAAGIYLNVVIVDFEFEVYSAIVHATIEFIIILLLLIPYIKDLKKFFWDMSGKFQNEQRKSTKMVTFGIPVIFIVLVSVSITMLTYKLISTENPIIGAYKIERLSIKGNAITLRHGEITKDPMLFFEFDNSCILSVNDSTYYGTYNSDGKKLMIALDHQPKLLEKINGVLYHNTINGINEKQDKIELVLKKISVKNRKRKVGGTE